MIRTVRLTAWLLPIALLGCDRGLKVTDTDIPIIRTADEVASAADDSTTVVVDVRKPDHYAAGHIPGAINIYLPEIRKGDTRLARAKSIIVYSRNVRDPLGIAAAKRFAALGYVNVREFKGGIDSWTESGRRLVGALPEAEVRPDTDRQ